MSGSESTTNDAERTLAAALSDREPPDPDAIKRALGKLLEADPGRAAEFAAAMRTQGVLPGAASMALAFVEYRAGDLDASAAHAEAALETYPQETSLLVLLAGIRASQQRAGEAAQVARRAVEAGAGDDPDVLMILGTSRMQLGRASQAIPILRKARSIDPSLSGIRPALFWSHILKWQVAIRLLAFICSAWAIVDASVLGWVMVAIAVAVFGSFAVLAARSRRAGTVLLLIALAGAVVAGHVLLAPSAFG